MDEYDEREDVEEEQEEGYDENADEDFNPDKAADEAANSSSSDDDEETAVAKPAPKSKKRKSEAVIEADLDSGDEATIKALPRKKRRKDAEDEDSGGEGGFIRTRAQRVLEKEERKHRKRARDGEVTVDVEQLWAELSSAPIGRAVVPPPQASKDSMDVEGEENKENEAASSAEDTITIKRRIEYAGEVTEVEAQVLRSSKEAKKYLAEHPEADPNYKKNEDKNESGLQRPLKRPSMFEPNPLSLVKGVAPEKLRPRAPSRMDVLMATKRAEEKIRAQKMSTVQKSALDWKGFVDNEGLREELDEYGKSKGGFLAREAFLDRAAGAREQAARNARLKL
ncbi:unnamed protein product [Zymoseptoria tritici ST99CH_1A5]|uniref:SWR1-complex protein 5 n=4 Tax=Zymoseptoria tritici TaxID=1047171 RepID=F9X4D6_ZYMTI|nr:uncharacterized protein MYCGRDRAFT_90673 [Zymoseptoria tritici IPO323]SMQ47529.1 unnamed protein product [Zymoseptoria tritici ST99CH_3D7]SMR46058.1 unnamed protein product [Zymoseptoria tritici ST99CH_1E4]SMR47312.1 unnamed protein product [Zymoseptoria tritici ST99CH_3D1]SMY21208.1 unnamed protein product [Zymoseptoria tritici ST99CH_1A5]EGP89877.1 hypothetical protein MYCGRDRAFT_90673 [Zymoseptoria tritici IPO323]